MRRVIMFLIVMLIATSAYAATVPTKVSGSTVGFTTGGLVVTFNSVTKHIVMWNESASDNCFVDIKCVDSTGKSGDLQLAKAVVKLPYGAGVTPNVVELDFATRNLGFIASAGNGGTVTYIVTGEVNDLTNVN